MDRGRKTSIQDRKPPSPSRSPWYAGRIAQPPTWWIQRPRVLQQRIEGITESGGAVQASPVPRSNVQPGRARTPGALTTLSSRKPSARVFQTGDPDRPGLYGSPRQLRRHAARCGDMDEAIRQLNVVIQREANSGMAYYLLSQAFARKSDYDDAIRRRARRSMLTPGIAEAHFWLAESLRSKEPGRRSGNPVQPVSRVIQLRQRHGRQAQLLCRRLSAGLRREEARGASRYLEGVARPGEHRALRLRIGLQKRLRFSHPLLPDGADLTPTDLFTNYRLGILSLRNTTKRAAWRCWPAARKHFENVIEQNPDANEADRSRKYVRTSMRCSRSNLLSLIHEAPSARPSDCRRHCSSGIDPSGVDAGAVDSVWRPGELDL